MVLGHGVLAPSTLGTFLRSFAVGHVRQLDAAGREMLRRAWAGDRGPGDGPLTIDMDSTVCEVYGPLKQGVGFGYTKVRGYHPLLVPRPDTGEVLHSRLRGGSAFTARGATGFLAETFSRVRAAGASGQLTLRADSGFHCRAVFTALGAVLGNRAPGEGGPKGACGNFRRGLGPDPVLVEFRHLRGGRAGAAHLRAHSGQFGRLFRLKPATHSGANRPGVGRGGATCIQLWAGTLRGCPGTSWWKSSWSSRRW